MSPVGGKTGLLTNESESGKYCSDAVDFAIEFRDAVLNAVSETAAVPSSNLAPIWTFLCVSTSKRMVNFQIENGKNNDMNEPFSDGVRLKSPATMMSLCPASEIEFLHEGRVTQITIGE